MKMANKEKTNEKYFVIEDGNSNYSLKEITFSTLKQAADYFFSLDSDDQNYHTIAKEIGIKTELDEENLKYKIVPVGDFESQKPYYLFSHLFLH